MNPQTLRGSRTGVYVGACVSEVEEGLAQDVSKVSGYALTGCSRSMFANRISYTFDFQGPSYAIDTACSSSFLAFQQALLGLRTGQCDQAIVGGVNICLRPVTALQFHKMNMLSVDGQCKYLDAEASESFPFTLPHSLFLVLRPLRRPATLFPDARLPFP